LGLRIPNFALTYFLFQKWQLAAGYVDSNFFSAVVQPDIVAAQSDVPFIIPEPEWSVRAKR